MNVDSNMENTQVNAWLLTWNPKKFLWDESIDGYEAVLKEIDQIGFSILRWSCGRTKKIQSGDLVYMIRVGCKNNRGIIARGHALSDVFSGSHWDKAAALRGETVNRIFVKFDSMVDLSREESLSTDLLMQKFPKMYWTPQSSGTSISPDILDELNSLWEEKVGK